MQDTFPNMHWKFDAQSNLWLLRYHNVPNRHYNSYFHHPYHIYPYDPFKHLVTELIYLGEMKLKLD